MVETFLVHVVGRTILSIAPALLETDRLVRPTFFLLAKQPVDPVLEQLDPPRRAAVIMALLALVLTGLVTVGWIYRSLGFMSSGLFGSAP